jgi:Zn finger protein HypA/HybF involved in hydrogenase expression
MHRLREELDTNEEGTATEGATKHRTSRNLYEVQCSACGDTYYVDQHVLREVESASEFDAAENRFTCEDCEEEYQEDEYSH